MILKSIFLGFTRMIDRESKFSKLQMPTSQNHHEEIDSVSHDEYPFLEVCDLNDIATGSGILEESNEDNSIRLGSIWVSVAKLAVPVMEGESPLPKF